MSKVEKVVTTVTHPRQRRTEPVTSTKEVVVYRDREPRKNEAAKRRARKVKAAKAKNKQRANASSTALSIPAEPGTDPSMLCMAACSVAPEQYLSICSKYGMDPNMCLPEELRKSGFELKLYKASCSVSSTGGDWFYVAISNAGYTSDMLTSYNILIGSGPVGSMGNFARDPKYIADSSLYSDEVIVANKVLVNWSQSTMNRSGHVVITEIPQPLSNQYHWYDNVSSLAGLKSQPGAKTIGTGEVGAYVFHPKASVGQVFAEDTGAQGGTAPLNQANTAYPTTQSSRMLPGMTQLVASTNIGYRGTSTAGGVKHVLQMETRPIGVIAGYGLYTSGTYAAFDVFTLIARRKVVPDASPAQHAVAHVSAGGIGGLLTTGAKAAESLVASSMGHKVEKAVLQGAADVVGTGVSLLPVPGAGVVGNLLEKGASELLHFL